MFEPMAQTIATFSEQTDSKFALSVSTVTHHPLQPGSLLGLGVSGLGQIDPSFGRQATDSFGKRESFYFCHKSKGIAANPAAVCEPMATTWSGDRH